MHEHTRLDPFLGGLCHMQDSASQLIKAMKTKGNFIQECISWLFAYNEYLDWNMFLTYGPFPGPIW